MKAQELRIDNWVYNSTTRQNMRVYPMMIPQLYRLEKENGSLKDCNIEPIPLTEEILLNLGFEKIHEISWRVEYRIDERYTIVYYKDDKCFKLFSPIASLSEVKYIHQLQNLYFAITGEELGTNL